jgi:hypothetical protein
MQYYTTIGAIQKCISNAVTLDEALEEIFFLLLV